MSALTQLSMQLPASPATGEAVSVRHPCVIWDGDAAYLYGEGGCLYRSADLISWNKVPASLPDGVEPGVLLLPKERFREIPEYRYYAVSGSSILLYVSSAAEGPYRERGVVLTIPEGEDAVAACPFPIADPVSGEHYLTYGRDGAIYVLHLNPRNGMAYETGLGVCVARRPRWCRYVSSPQIVYNDKNEYYYLLLTYGDESDANIRVGRSKRVTGPYLDAMGRLLTDVDDFNGKVGTMLMAGYRFDDHEGCVSPMDGQLFQAGNLGWILAHTAICGKKGRILQIRRVIWTDDGWCTASPEPYAGETVQQAKVSDIPGRYELISFVPRLPQSMVEFVKFEILTLKVTGVSSTRNNWAFRIPHHSQGRVELGGSHRGSWVWLDERVVEVRYPNITVHLTALPAWDWENGEPTIVLVGMDSKGQVVWGKRRDLARR